MKQSIAILRFGRAKCRPSPARRAFLLVRHSLGAPMAWAAALGLALLLAIGPRAEPVRSGNELLVKWRDGPGSDAAARGNALIGARVKRHYPASGWQLVELPKDLAAAAGIAAYRAQEAVAAVERNERRAMPAAGLDVPNPPSALQTLSAGDGLIPNDPLFRTRQWNLRKVGATNAWATTTGTTNVVVAVFDTGVDHTHPDLAPNMWRNPGESGLDAAGNDRATNGIDDDNNGYVDDLHGIDAVTGSGDSQDRGFDGGGTTINHGTFVAGVIGAVGNNNLGIAGINWTTQIMALDVVDSPVTATPETAYEFEISATLAAWDYVLQMRRRGANVRVISDSVGVTAHSIAIEEVVAALTAENVIVVWAAGNDSWDMDIYSGYYSLPNQPALIQVAHSNESDQLSGSNFGRSTVHLAAPGANITSPEPGGGYRTASGTSYACPLVSGAAALLLAARPGLTSDQVKAALLGSVDHPPALRGKLVTGGRLNVDRAMKSLTNAELPTIIVTSLPAGPGTAPDSPLRVTFSRSMDQASVESAFSIQPSIEGKFEWSRDSHSFLFRHDVPFDRTTNYIVTIRGSALDQNKRGVDGNFNQETEGSPADDYSWTFRFPVLNDNFIDAQILNGGSGQTGGTTRYTLREPEEEPIRAFEENFFNDGINVGSVWYHWAAPDPGAWYTFDLAGASFDPYLAICTGSALGNLRTIAGNDNYGNNRSSRVSFRASATNYFITVITKNGSPGGNSGPFNLRWYPTPSPGFTGAQFLPARAVPGTQVTLTGTNFTGATAVLFHGVSAAGFANSPSNNFDLRITATVPPGALPGPITVLTPHGSVTSSASFQPLPPPLSLRFDQSGRAELAWGQPATYSWPNTRRTSSNGKRLKSTPPKSARIGRG